MSKEGLITSDVIKNAVFAMSDEINTLNLIQFQ